MYTRGPDTGHERVLTQRRGNGDDGAVADARMLVAKIWSVLQNETKSGRRSTYLLSWSCEVASTHSRSRFGVQLSS